MTKYLLLIICLSGCTPPNNMNVVKGKYLCRDHGGLYRIHPARQNPVECADGTLFSISKLQAVIIKDPKYLPKAI